MRVREPGDRRVADIHILVPVFKDWPVVRRLLEELNTVAGGGRDA